MTAPERIWAAPPTDDPEWESGSGEWDVSENWAASCITEYVRADLAADPAQVRVRPTDAQINSACLSYRHDFGLRDKRDQDNLRFQANEWLIAWQKEARILSAIEPQPLPEVHEEQNTEQSKRFWAWLPLAYRDGHVGEQAKFTKYNMEVAHYAGWCHAIEPQPDPHDAQIATLVEALRGCITAIEHADMADGVCCCGDEMEGHSDPMDCGHTPTDRGEHYAHQVLTAAKAALSARPAAFKGGKA